jgi:DNA uptake protein ComE-like DNA-binding protein
LAIQPINLTFNPPPAGRWHIVMMLREWTASGFATRDFVNFEIPFVSAPVAEKTPAQEVAKSVAPVTPVSPAKAPVAKAATPVAPIAPAKASAVAAAKGVSVNTARVEELAAVKGLTSKLAEGIVKKRPFGSLDELLKVKGLGERILARVRSSLRL